MQLTDKEHDVVTDHWDNSIPSELNEVETEQLLEMVVHVARAVGASIQDGDVESLEVLEPLEEKISNALRQRL